MPEFVGEQGLESDIPVSPRFTNLGLSAQPDWLPGDGLTDTEEMICVKAASGEPVDLGISPLGSKEVEAWPEGRTIRAAVLRHLLIEDEWPISVKGTRLRGVRLHGHLDLEAAVLRCPLVLNSCYFDASDPVSMDLATASIVTLTECRLAGLNAASLTSLTLDLSASTLMGPVSLQGAQIAGLVSCRGARLEGRDDDGYALDASRLHVGDSFLLDDGFSAYGAIRLIGADVGGQLSFVDAQLMGHDNRGRALVADGMKVRSGAFFAGLAARGSVRLLGAEIAGQLSFRGAKLDGRDDGGYALSADGMRVTGPVFMNDASTENGAIGLSGVDIAGPLVCTEARLSGRDNAGDALIADRVKVVGGTSLDGVFAGNGAVRLLGADIAGQISFRGARLAGNNSYGYALDASGLKVTDDVLLDGGFTSAGTISFSSARIGGSVEFKPTALVVDAGVALDATRAQIEGALRWAPGAPVIGKVDLRGAAINELADEWTPEGASVNGYWPTGGRLQLEGFTYGRLGGNQQATRAQRLEWIRSQYESVKGSSFASQPYEQLVAVYRESGQDTNARNAAIARRSDQRKYGGLSLYRKAVDWVLDKTIKYGYETWRAAVVLAVVYIAVFAMSIVAQHLNLIVPVGNLSGVHPIPVASHCTASYPCFYPAGYAIDTVIPIINVHQADFWGLNGSAWGGWAWVAGSWLATGAGWALATLLVAGYTGIVRRI